MTAESIERVLYYESQYLSAADFVAEQRYHRQARWRHDLGPHTWGIVLGMTLDMQPEGAGVSYYLLPGMAIDGYARDLVVAAPYKLDPAAFQHINTPDVHVDVWIGYDEVDASPPGFGYQQCEGDLGFRRTMETWRIFAKPGGDTDDGVVVDGQTVPAPSIVEDGSVPYQEFPDDSDRRWLIRLGTVKWDGAQQVFLPVDPPERLNEERRHIGAVAEQLLAPAETLTIRRRTTPAELDGDEFATVEGRLAVEGRLTASADVYVNGGKVWFNESNGFDEGTDTELSIRRTGAGKTLAIRLGSDGPDSQTALVIGPAPSANAAETPVLRIRADHKLDLPDGVLRFGRETGQVVEMGNPISNINPMPFGIGLQTDTLYHRAPERFCWYHGGKHDDAAGSPGEDGELLMSLTADQLLVEKTIRTRGHLTVGHLADRWLRTRHVRGKEAGSNGDDALYLNYHTQHPVHVGREDEGDLHVHGNLFVNGAVATVVHVKTYTKAVTNAGIDTAATWSQSVAADFAEIYAAFAVLQGLSIVDNAGDTTFPERPHIPDGEHIPQHVFVRVTKQELPVVEGVCYCSQSDSSKEANNTVLFTLVVIGRKA